MISVYLLHYLQFTVLFFQDERSIQTFNSDAATNVVGKYAKVNYKFINLDGQLVRIIHYYFRWSISQNNPLLI